MDIRELQLFLKLSETLHYGRTSQLMSISPSALSRTIQRMEEDLGQRLFVRDNRTVHLTTAGIRFQEYARSVLHHWQSMKDDLSLDGMTLTGELRLYSSVTGCYTILPEILKKYRLLYPDVHIHLETGGADKALTMLLSDQVDAVVAALPDTLSETLLFREVTTTPLILVGPREDGLLKEQLSRKEVPWAEIPMILPDKGLARKRIDLWFRQQNITPEIYAEVSGNEAILAMVSLGFGVGVVPELVYQKSPAGRDVIPLSMDHPLEPYTVGICTSTRRMDVPPVKAFLESLNGRDLPSV